MEDPVCIQTGYRAMFLHLKVQRQQIFEKHQ